MARRTQPVPRHSVGEKQANSITQRRPQNSVCPPSRVVDSGAPLSKFEGEGQRQRAEKYAGEADEEHMRAAALFVTPTERGSLRRFADASALRARQVQFTDAAYDTMWPGQPRAAGKAVIPR